MPKTAEKTDQSKLKKKASPAGIRRYKKGTFAAYDREYHRLEKSSPILGRSGSRDMKNAFAGSGLGNCQRDLIQLVGDDSGNYKEENTWHKALIPAAKDNLKTVYADFKRWATDQVKNGHALEPPETWPTGLLQERLKAEARLDLRRKEKTFLKERIEELKKEQGKLPADQPMLPDGPVGKFQGGGSTSTAGRIKSVDGQNVSYSPSGVPYIDHPDSPYDQMPIAVYRKMSKQWMRKHHIRRMDLVKRRNEYKKEMNEKGKADELPTMFSVSKFEERLKKNGAWPEFPEWPSYAKPINELETGP